jgi:hypothetical protein
MMKKYGEYFAYEDGTWLGRWYEGDEVKDTKEGTAKSVAEANKQAQAWLASKKDK